MALDLTEDNIRPQTRSGHGLVYMSNAISLSHQGAAAKRHIVQRITEY